MIPYEATHRREMLSVPRHVLSPSVLCVRRPDIAAVDRKKAVSRILTDSTYGFFPIDGRLARREWRDESGYRRVAVKCYFNTGDESIFAACETRASGQQ